jgi:hypothetical protein
MTAATPQIDIIRDRVAALRAKGLEPIEVIMSPETWQDLRREYRAGSAAPVGRVILARMVFGLRSQLVPGTLGTAIRYFGGTDVSPDQALTDRFNRSPSLFEPPRPAGRR